MAITLDASTPAGFGAGASATSITSAAFTPPIGSRIILLFGADSNAGETTNVTATGTGGDAITFAKSVRNSGLYAEVWISDPCPTAISRTVTASVSGGGGATLLWAQPLVLNGVDPTTPLGATGFNASANTSNVANPTAYTSTVDNSLCVFVAMDDSNNGAPTTTDVGFAATTTGESWIAGYKAAATTPAGSTVTINLDAAGAAAATWWWAAAEILPAAGVTTAPTQPVLTATPNVGPSMHLSWTVSDGGSPITDALVEGAPDVSGSPGTYTTFTHGALGTTAAIEATGLTAGNWYWFRVSAINAIGTSTASTAVRAKSSEAIVASTKPRFAFPTKAPGRVRRIQATRGVNRAQATADDIAALVFGAGVSTGTGSAVVNNTFNATAVGAMTPKGSATVNDTFNPVALGKRVPKGLASVSDTFDPSASGKRVPKGSAVVNDAFDPAAFGKRFPQGSAVVNDTFNPTAAGQAPVVGGAAGSALISDTFNPVATGKRTPKGSGSISDAFDPTAVGKRTPKGSAAVSDTFNPVATGKRVPKGAAAITDTFDPTAAGKRVPKAAGVVDNQWAVQALGFAPQVGVNRGNGSILDQWDVSATGKRTPKGSASASDLWQVTAAGVAPAVPQHLGAATVATVWPVAAVGARMSKGASAAYAAWALEAFGDSTGMLGTLNGIGFVEWMYEGHEIVDWLVGA